VARLGVIRGVHRDRLGIVVDGDVGERPSASSMPVDAPIVQAVPVLVMNDQAARKRPID
jgi:hypothetical protein